MTSKRQLQLSPSENISNCTKSAKMGNDDKFSWSMMSDMLDTKLDMILDEKLADVARKEDINALKTELNAVKAENEKLRLELSQLSARMERIDKKTRQSSVVVNGLKCVTPVEAKSEFKKLCSEVLSVNVNVSNCSKLGKKSFVFNMESTMMVQDLLTTRSKLKGTSIYIQKDYTAQEQHIRYNLRQISKNIRDKNRSLKVRLGDLTIFVNDKKFNWFNNKVIANSQFDADFLKDIFIKCNISYEIIVNANTKLNQSE